jgi:drug/metabolite transporter (DMT)-like permease
MLVLTRRSYKTDILTGTLLGGCFSGIFGLFASIFISQSMSVSSFDLSVMLIMGAFEIGLGITLVTLAAPFVPSAEVSILVLLESVLGPLWVWAFLNETMSGSELAGGLIILLSVCMLSYPTGWYQKNFR